jgi:hypothetical protein
MTNENMFLSVIHRLEKKTAKLSDYIAKVEDILWEMDLEGELDMLNTLHHDILKDAKTPKTKKVK